MLANPFHRFPHKKSLHFNFILALFVFLLFNAVSVQPGQAAGTIYVSAAATGSNNGSNWSNAYTSLQDALATASPGDMIWVSQGIYTPGTNPTDTFELPFAVGIYGGFSGTPGSEGDFDARNWQLFPTVLSGDLFSDDTTDANGVVASSTDIVGTNSYNIVYAMGLDNESVLDGFYITGGNANGSNFYPCGHECGAGLTNWDGNPVLSNLVFSGNFATNAGAGIYNFNGTPQLSGLSFIGNTAGGLGGGIYNEAGGPSKRNASPLFENVSFSNNSAQFGGGLANLGDGAVPDLNQVTFDGNQVSGSGGAIYNAENSNPTITNSTFTNNQAGQDGGAIANFHSSSPTISNSTFTGNSATGQGGAIANAGSSTSPQISNTLFSQNQAGGNGGAIANIGTNSRPVIYETTFEGNLTSESGGALYNGFNSAPAVINGKFYANQAANFGGGIYNTDANLTLVNASLVGNIAENGGGIATSGIVNNATLINSNFLENVALTDGGGMYNNRSAPAVQNTIFWNNASSRSNSTEVYNDDSRPAISYSLVQTGCPARSTCEEMIAANPRFTRSPNAGDGDWTTLSDNDYGDANLLFGSPAIDAGNNAYITVETDLLGLPRIVAENVDIGACESQLAFHVFVPLSDSINEE